MKKKYKVLSLLLVGTLTIGVIPSVCANAKEINVLDQTNESSNIKFDKNSIPDDEVIAYIEGIAITKDDIDENGKITANLNYVQENSLLSENKIRATSLTIPSRLPSGYKEACIVKKLNNKQARLSQTTTDMYLTVSNARKMATKFDVSSYESLASYVVTLFPGTTVVGLELLLSQGQRSEVASDIRSYTDNDQQVRFRVIKTSYGTLYRVDYWNGKTLDTTLHDEIVSSIKYN